MYREIEHQILHNNVTTHDRKQWILLNDTRFVYIESAKSYSYNVVIYRGRYCAMPSHSYGINDEFIA